MEGILFNPITGIPRFEVEDLSDGDYGETQLLSDGKATSVTAIDLSAVAQPGDLLDLLVWAYNASTTARTCELFRDAAGTKHKFLWNALDQGASATSQMAFCRLRVGADPAASLYYKWSTAPAEGCSVWTRFRTKARSIRWL